jgi:hypothetical protein
MWPFCAKCNPAAKNCQHEPVGAFHGR